MQRLNCEKYPCHFPEQDCAFCFCPFYPCMDPRTGGRVEGGDWCCEACTVVHQQEISETIMDALMKGEDLSVAWRKLEGML